MSLPSIKSLASTFRTRLEEVKTMSSITTTVARQYRLQEWASQIRECQRRPQNLTVKDWCVQHQITVANYYYRLRQVREACLEGMTSEVEPQSVVAVPAALMERASSTSDSCTLEIKINSIMVS